MYKFIFTSGIVLTLAAQTALAQSSPFQNYKLFARPKQIEDFNFVDDTGKSIYVSDFKGQVVLLNFWASWCTPCVKELPALDQLAKEFAPLGLKIIPLNVEPKDSTLKILRYYEKLGIKNLGVYQDPQGRNTKNLEVPSYPYTMVIARDGTFKAEIKGFTYWTSEDAKFVLKTELSEGIADYIDQTYNPQDLLPNFKKSPVTDKQNPYEKSYQQPQLWKNPEAFGVGR